MLTLIDKIINSKSHIKSLKLLNESLDNLNKQIIKDDKYYYPNLDFINKFYDMIKITELSTERNDIDKQKCIIEDKDNPLASGKVASVYKKQIKIDDKEISLIKKSIDNIGIKKYLSLKIIKTDNEDNKFNYLIKQHKFNFEYKYNNPIFSSFSSVLPSRLTKPTKFTGIISVGTNNFTNQTIMHLILNKILTSNPNYIYQYDAFICKNDSGYSGINITKNANRGSLDDYLDKVDEVTDDLIKDILKQILSVLRILKSREYCFNHSDLKCKNIFVHKDEKDKTIYKIADFDKSSIFWNKIRFYNESIISRFLTSTTSVFSSLYYIENTKNNTYKIPKIIPKIIPKNITSMIDQLKPDKLTPDNIIFNLGYTMNNPVPNYMSYDIYTFILSLLCHNKVFEKYNNGKLKNFIKIIKLLFEEQEIMNLLQKIYKDSKDNTKDQSSIKYYLELLIELNIELKIDIEAVYEEVEEVKEEEVEEVKEEEVEEVKEKRRLYLLGGNTGGNYHICTSRCTESICNSNKYSSRGSIQTTSNC